MRSGNCWLVRASGMAGFKGLVCRLTMGKCMLTVSHGERSAGARPLRGSGRPDPSGGVRAHRQGPIVGGRVGRGPAGQPAGGVAAPEGAQGGAAGGRRGSRDAAHLPARSARHRRHARVARRPLGRGARRLQGLRRGAGEGSSPMTIAPIVKTLTVQAPPERAFAAFTGRMGAWWPKGQTVGAKPHAEVVMEPRAGGRWFERDAEGAETQWGKVLAWEPPGRVLLAWQLNGQWAFDPDFVTELELTFTPARAGGTEVRLEHRNLERFG